MIPIIYASQTGNSLHLANLLCKINPLVYKSISLECFDWTKINNFEFIIFIVSTHGFGQPPFNAAEFYDTICNIPCTDVFTFKFAMLSLGDSSYQKFCHFGNVLSKKLTELGAVEILYERGDSMDPDGMYEGYFRFENFIKNNFKDRDENDIVNLPLKLKEEYEATAIENTEINSDLFELKLEVKNYNNFYPGDCIGILPQSSTNFPHLNISENRFLQENVDFRATPHWTIFQELGNFTDNTIYKEKIKEISESYDLYYSYVLKPKRTILEICYDLGIKELPFEFLKNLNQIVRRFYSVSKTGESTFSILYNIHKIKTGLSTDRLGLCTQFMKKLKIGEKLQIVFGKSRLYFEDKNLLFFCTGTGFTLPRSVIYHNFSSPKNIIIYYGYRNKEDDLTFLVENNPNFNKFTLYKTSSAITKKYIMGLFREKNGIQDINKWLVFVSGNCRLNKEIKNTLKREFLENVNFQSETW